MNFKNTNASWKSKIGLNVVMIDMYTSKKRLSIRFGNCHFFICMPNLTESVSNMTHTGAIPNFE